MEGGKDVIGIGGDCEICLGVCVGGFVVYDDEGDVVLLCLFDEVYV